MKKIGVIVIFLTCNIFYAQEEKLTSLTVKVSDEYKDEVSTSSILAIHTTSNNKTGVVRNSRKSLVFDIFDASLSKTFNKVIETDRKEYFKGELFINDELRIFTVYAPRKTERIIYCHILNLQTQNYKKIKVFETTVEKGQSLFSGKNKRKTKFVSSDNGKYVAIATDNIKRHSNAYTVRVFESESLKLVYSKSYQEDEEKYFVFKDMSIDDNGTVYSLGKLFKEGRRQKKNGEANYQFVLNKITKDNVETIAIDLEELYIMSLSISVAKGELHLLGFYSEQNVGKVKGGCNFTIGTDNFAVKGKNTYQLPIEVYEDLYGDKRADRHKEKELNNFYLDYVLTDDNGNTYLLAEEFYVTVQYVSTGYSAGYTQTINHYDDIIVLKFDSTGSLKWGRSIFKKAEGPSYNAFIKDNQLHVILNSGKHLKEKNDGRTKVSTAIFESSALYDIVYTEEGEVSYDKIQDNRGNEYYIPFYGTYENDRLIMMGYTKKKQFMILE